MQRRYFLPVFLLVLCLGLIMRRNSRHEEIYVQEISRNLTTNGSENMLQVTKHQPLPRIKIAFYHPYHGGLKHQFKALNMSKCVYNNCDVRFTGTTSRVVEAHAVLFQGNHIAHPSPKRRNLNQVFIFVDIEAPQYIHFTRLDNKKWKNFFNWTMTYRLDSDIPYPYGSVVVRPEYANRSDNIMTPSTKKTIKEVLTNLSPAVVDTALQKMMLSRRTEKDYKAIFKRKTKIAAWLVSHCITASKREKYVNLMKKYIHIDVFGKCTKRVCKKESAECRSSIIKKYFFYLSFENSLCIDYVTEKEFNWFNEDIITVVRGARTYRNYLPSGTYIDAGDFKSPAHLAKFLNELSKDEERYIAYLKRKDHFETIEKGLVIQNTYCELCKRLNHLERYRKSIRDIHAWWKKGACTQPFDIYGLPPK